MHFLVDECTGPLVALWLREQGHLVFSVYEQGRGMSDNQVIDLAWQENYILITNDKDFGEKIFREQRPHHGVILLRLEDERVKNKIGALQRVLSSYQDRITDHFMVVTETRIRISGKSSRS